MDGSLSKQGLTPRPGLSPSFAAYAVIIALGAGLAWLSARHPTLMPPFGPWEFSWPIWLASTLTLFWFARGLKRTARPQRIAMWRRILFTLGLLLIYAMVETRFDYLAQHMFFLNRIQNVVMHHLGPFLIALGRAGDTIGEGMPRWMRRLVHSRPASIAMGIVQQPLLAVVLFVGLYYFWLIPSVHFRAMLDTRLYQFMNWSMAIDGILFWSLVLDPRGKPPARSSFAVRAALAVAGMVPQIVLGAAIALANRDLYPSYALCGRLYSGISAIADQRIGGIIIWNSAGDGAIALILVINALRLHEEKTAALQ